MQEITVFPFLTQTLNPETQRVMNDPRHIYPMPNPSSVTGPNPPCRRECAADKVEVLTVNWFRALKQGLENNSC